MIAEPKLPAGAVPLDLDRLPALNPWPALLLGLETWTPKRRDRQEVLREYDTEKWGGALETLREHQGELSQDDILRAAGAQTEQTVAFSLYGKLYSAKYGEVLQAYLDWLVECVRPFEPGVLVELGSGLGDKLLWMQRHLNLRSVRGGEFTPSGVASGEFLAQRTAQQAEFFRFDFTDPATLASVPEGAVVYSSHAIEQIPVLTAAFVDGLIERRPKVVLHFEPCYEGCPDNSLMGLMSRRYAQLNDYNTNLKGLLESHRASGRIELMGFRHDVFGINPFNPTTLYVWRPTGS